MHAMKCHKGLSSLMGFHLWDFICLSCSCLCVHIISSCYLLPLLYVCSGSMTMCLQHIYYCCNKNTLERSQKYLSKSILPFHFVLNLIFEQERSRHTIIFCPLCFPLSQLSSHLLQSSTYLNHDHMQ